MRLLTANKILLGSCAIAVPLSFYGGLALKEYYLANELPKAIEERQAIHERSKKARIVQLAQERSSLLEEQDNVNQKIRELQSRMRERH